MIKWLLEGIFMLLKKVKNWIKDKSTYPVKSVGRPRLQINEMAVRKAYSEGISIAEIARRNRCSETTIRRRLGI